MSGQLFRVALVSEVFTGPDADRQLHQLLAEARDLGAELAVLPELPLNPWSPATREPREKDAEPTFGPRHERLQAAARTVGIGLVGGAIVRDPDTGLRHDTALVFDATGDLLATYRKVHLPAEPGFWETSHYDPGDRPPETIHAFSMPLGIQICSDVNRPTGSYLLAAHGAEAILCPRATESATFDRWRLVLRANALTSCCYVLSVNRPRPEQGVLLGGPSIAIDPEGEVLQETTDTLCIVELHGETLRMARNRYPGYLPTPSSLYASAWSTAPATRLPHARDREP